MPLPCKLSTSDLAFRVRMLRIGFKTCKAGIRLGSVLGIKEQPESTLHQQLLGQECDRMLSTNHGYLRTFSAATRGS